MYIIVIVADGSTLYRTDDFIAKNRKKLLERVYNFGVYENYIYASVLPKSVCFPLSYQLIAC